tara:strand:+ start:1219 stop:2202 length:984 start_codon:yes stop_codon:yes gene_type:complete
VNKNKNSFNVPILLILFNRPQYIEESINSINLINPNKLYIHIDGPRNDIDNKKIEEIKTHFSNLKKTIEIKILNQEKNLGCSLGVVTAIDWFFQNEEYGIILEDDLIPNISFYYYCQALLEKFKNDKNIFMISGDNGGELIPSNYFNELDFISSPVPLIWGWATWRDRWEKYKYKIPNINPIKLFFLLNQFKFFERLIVIKYFYKIKNPLTFSSTWDILFFYTMVLSNMNCIIPKQNLISNVGFDEQATHTKEKTFRSNADTYELIVKNFELNYLPKEINSKIIYLILTNLNRKVVHSNKIVKSRILYLISRFAYFFRVLKSKLGIE